MLYSIANKSGSRREIKKIKKIQAEASKKGATIVAVLSVMIPTPIPQYPAITSNIPICGLLDVRRRTDWIT